MTISQHLDNQINYYQREISREEKNENPTENEKAYAEVLKIMIRALKVEERKLLKVK